ncbi:septation ring formation regulator EzrA [Metabacillus sp. KIGAM252]|uniref:Septation ring formation regulator EzrA n=1 Tax=Metabacillus flavus TaxID=2823519 RepID=A0ABS5LI22_9BACI|nr:septation ring formation regulator EzrA [Metabacillus flavus]MBS2970024.1 septation ring formation regulator EzrA [Metabacillus flavus]
MEVVIGLLAALVIFFAAGYFIRKNIYREVDRLEARKIEIMNRSLADEMSRVKELKMTGQAEELFEKWRLEWDEIITSQLPEVEELLFDAEDHADKYRFKKSKEVLAHIERMLEAADQNIEQIIEEIYELVTSEERNSIEIEDVKEKFKKAKKTLLAHSHTFGRAHAKLETGLYEVYEELKRFEAETDAGNYLAAREILTKQNVILDELCAKIEMIPAMLADCQSGIPNQLAEISDGYKEMAEQGYFLEHIQIQSEAERISGTLIIFQEKICELELDGISESLQEIHESIETMYDLLEKEVHAHHFVLSETAKTEGALHELTAAKLISKEETDTVKKSYHLSEEETSRLRSIDKQVAALQKRFNHIQDKMASEKIAYSLLKEELLELEKQMSEVRAEHNEYREMLHALRKEELLAREQLTEARRLLSDSARLISKSNVPGMPAAYSELLREAQKTIAHVSEKLDEIPLDMVAVNILLEDAVAASSKVHQQTEDMIEQVYYVEKIIQYGNRFRSRNEKLSKELHEAENLFRHYEYESSLKKAATAIEHVEPGSFEKIGSLVEEDLEELKNK